MPLYSHSQLETFENCPLRYKFRYLDRIRKPEEQSIEAFVGSCVHTTLQKLYDDLLLRKLNSLDELLAHYLFIWNHAYQPTIKIVQDGLTGEDYLRYGEQCLRNYYARFHPFDQSQTLGTETHLIFALDPKGEYKFQGYIDRLARRKDGTYEIHDYKTGRQLPTQAEADSNRQLALYQIGLASQWQDVDRVELVWHYMARDSTLISRRTPEQLKDLTERTIQLVDTIEKTGEFLPVKSRLCDWCEYRAECPIWKHVEAVKDLPREEFDKDDGVKLANEYAQTKFDFDRLGEKLELLKETIIQFAREQGIATLQGKNVKVSVTSRQLRKVPRKDDPLRGPLEELLRKSGKWDEVSGLDVSQLLRSVEEDGWEPGLLSQLREYLTTEPSFSVRVSRDEETEEKEE